VAKLTNKQQAFCEHYVSNGFNATQAAISAGYSEKTAGSIGGENLQKPEIVQEIAKFQARVADKAEITALDLVAELEEARELAKEQGQGSVLVSATMGKAKLLGLEQNILQHQGANGGPIKTDNKFTIEIIKPNA